MQPPVAVPAKGGPLTLALVTRPDGANVMTTLATPEGSPSFLQAEAWAAPAVRAALAVGAAGSGASVGVGARARAGSAMCGAGSSARAAGPGSVGAEALRFQIKKPAAAASTSKTGAARPLGRALGAAGGTLF